jgi:hypothetical protein
MLLPEGTLNVAFVDAPIEIQSCKTTPPPSGPELRENSLSTKVVPDESKP